MITTLIYHRVADYDAWEAAYHRVLESSLGEAVRSYQAWRGLDDPNLVILAESYETREAAEAALANPDLPEAIAAAGVEMSSLQIHYVDEVLSGTH